MQPKFSAVQRAYDMEKLTMTTTHNVTELQPRMTREQLIDAARTAAKYLPVASAQLMNEIATRLDYTSVALCEAMEQRKSLAIENTVLREDATSWAKECDRIVERYTKTRSNMHLLEAQRELRDLTPTTDSFLAEVRASVIPEGYVLVPQQIFLEPSDIESICSQCGDGHESGYGDFTDGLLWVGNIQRDDGSIVHGLHISSADYTEEGGVTVCEFAAQPRKGVQP